MPDALKGVDLAFVDMDGVLYLGEKPIGNPGRAIERLRTRVRRVLFLTNNATMSRIAYTRKLRKIGVRAEKSEIITSAYGASLYLRRFKKSRVLAVGESGLLAELRGAGISVLRFSEARRATHVVAALDRNLNYLKIAAAARAIFSGAKFIATNTDATYPTERGLIPGAGATVGAITGCTGCAPEKIIGKPSTFMLELGLKLSGISKRRAVMIGDRLDTDIAAAERAGIRSILVLSGVTRERDLSLIHI